MLILGAAAAVALAVAATQLAPSHRSRLFAPASPLARPIPDTAAVDPDSARYVRAIGDAVRAKGFSLSARRWTIPVYRAGASTPETDVRLLADWAPARVLAHVPIPPGARPDPAADRHLAVIDRSRGCEYELFGARRAGTGWTAEWANAIGLDSSGIFRGGLSSRGSGFALTAGLVFPDELRRGSIRHALVFTAPLTRAGGPVVPATSSDGTSRSREALPEGARLQLDPALDLDAMRLKPWQKTVATALQQYGMFLVDTGGAVAIQAVNAASYREDPYAGVLPRTPFAQLPPKLVRHLRVLRLPMQRAVQPRLDAGGCATFRQVRQG
jgi:hypothetical protein